MPSSPFRPIARGPTISDILKFIPQSWKQPPRLIPGTPEIQHESIPDALFKSLGDFAANGHLHDAFRTLSLLRHQSSCAGSSDFILYSTASLLSACVDVNEFVPGLQIHAHCISSGLEFNPVLVPKLVTFYSAFNLLDEAQTITENSYILDSLPWNVLIASYIGRKRVVEATTAYKRMVIKGIRPDAFTYPSVLKACGELLDFATGRVVHGSIEVSSYRGDLYVCNALISMYKKFGKVSIARSLFDTMPERDAVSWNAVINCYASEGMWEEALKLFDGMQFSGVEASVVTWNTIAGGCLQTGNYLGALSVVAKMRKCNVRLDPIAVIIGLKACSYIGALQWGRIFHGLAIQSSYDRIDNMRNSLITMYSRCHDLGHALIVFQQTETKSLTTWNSIISGFAYNDRPEEASFLLKEMLLTGIHPNYVTLASLRVSNLQHGKEFHCYILRRQSFKDCLILWNALVDMYAKSRKLVAAKRVCDSMSKKDKVTYTSLIDGYGMMGEGQVALARFKEMIKSRIKPDHVTMVAVLSACSHSNLVQEGQILFEKMQYMYGIHPRLEHFSCMVDLYSRVGLLGKARDIIRSIPYEPSTAMWATLLKACLSHRNTDIGEWAAEKLLELMPENLGCYVLIANMYAAAGSWSKYEKVWAFMRDLGVLKAPEFACVETGSGFSQSLVDGSNEPIRDGVGYATNQEQSSDEERLAETG